VDVSLVAAIGGPLIGIGCFVVASRLARPQNARPSRPARRARSEVSQGRAASIPAAVRGASDATVGWRPPIARSAIVNFSTQVTVGVLSLINLLLVARLLGPTGRGKVAFLTAIAYLTSQLATLGVQWANGNLAASEPRTRPALATNSVLLAFLFGSAAAGFVAALVAVFPAVGGHASRGLLFVALASIPMLVLQNYLMLLVLADYGFRAFNSAIVLAPLTNVSVNGMLAELGLLSPATAFSTWVGGQALVTAVLAMHLERSVAGFGRPDVRLAWRAVVFGAKAHFGRVMLLGNYRLDQWIVGAMSGSRALGLYSVAVAWAESVFYLPTAVQTVQRPDLVRASPAEAGRQAATAFRATLLASVPLALGLIVAAPVLCVTILGQQFQGSVEQLRILAPGVVGIAALKLLGSALTAQGKPMLETAAIGIALAVTVALDVLLIPHYGGLGAAVASTTAYTIGGVAVALIFVRGLGSRLDELAPRVNEVPRFWRQAQSSLRHRWRPADR
jgi:O-antigen/teichoic acid export membrane protein